MRPAAPPVCRGRDHNGPDVRRLVVRALEDFGDTRAFDVLAALSIGDADEGVRQSAVEAVASLAGDASVGVLTRSLREDPDVFVRYEALLSLARVGRTDVVRSVQEALRDADELIQTKAMELLDAPAGD